MRQLKAYIVYRKNNDDDEDRAKEIKKAVFTASQTISKPIDIELTTNSKDFDIANIKQDEMPILIINNAVVFTKRVPPIDYIKQCISTPTDQQNHF